MNNQGELGADTAPTFVLPEGATMEQVLELMRAMHVRLTTSEREREAAESLGNGTYYSSIDQVWKPNAVPYLPEDFNALRRSEAPNFVARKDTLNAYKETKEKATSLTYDILSFRTVRGGSSSSKPDAKAEVWPKDFLGREELSGTDIAHLVPASHSTASLYFDVAAWALGLPENASWETLQKAIHGSRITAGKNREAYTGMKHMVSNKIRMAKQAAYLDNSPSVLIVPAIDLKFILDWQGEGYSALVMVGESKGDDARIGTICTDIRLKEKGAVASSDEIERARSVLSQVVRAMAYSLHKRSEGMGHNLPPDSQTKLRDLRNSYVPPIGEEGVSVPEATGQESLRVRLVTFEDADSVGPGHPAPDPLLLAVRAAINWSRRHGQDLLAAEEHKEEGSDLDDLAMEEFLEWRDQQHRAGTLEDVAVGLGYIERRGSAASTIDSY